MKRHRGIPESKIMPMMRGLREWYKPPQLLPFEPSAESKVVKPPKFATIDIETQSWINYVCGEVYWKDKHQNEASFETNDIKDLLIKCFEIRSKHKIKNFVAHYGGKFDFLFFIKTLIVDLNCEITKILPRGSSIMSFTATLDESCGIKVPFKLPVSITFKDSAALLPFGLGSITKSFNVETLKGEMDFLFVEKVYKEEDYLDDILECPYCTMFYNKKQIKTLSKDKRTRKRSSLRYWNSERHIMFPCLKKMSYTAPYMLKVDKKGKIQHNDWFEQVTFPIFEKADLLKYLHDDCKSLYQCIEAFFNAPLINQSKRKWTTASQAVEVFRLFLKQPLHSIPDSDDFWYEGNVDEFVRKAYFGGRTEIFKPVFDSVIMDKECLYYYDVNSLYPFCMRNFEFGDRFLGWVKGQKEYDKYDMAVWHCKVKVPLDLKIPVLGKKHEERLVFPVGEFSGYFTKYELEYAKTFGCEILELYEGAAFENVGFIFKEFVDTLYQMRLDAKEKGDNVTQMVMKLIMNSCYGRMGINKERSKIIIDKGLYNNVKFIADIELGNDQIIRLSEKKEISRDMFSNPFIACMVTSYARVHLHKQMVKVGFDSVYYGDSVTKDRMVPVMDTKGLVSIKSFDELWRDHAKDISTRGTKEVAACDLKTLSWDAEKKKLEFKAIKQIIRHKTNKKVFEVRSNKGMTRCTEDHSLINKKNEKIAPDEIVDLFSPKKYLSSLKTKTLSNTKIAKINNWRNAEMIDTFLYHEARQASTSVLLKSSSARLPDYVFNIGKKRIKKFLKDMGFRTSVISWYFVKSETAANQVSFLLSLVGVKHRFAFSEKTKKFAITINSCASKKSVRVKEIPYDDYVYDLSVEKNENFFDAMGLIGLHNTDSVFTDTPMETGKELGAMKLEYTCKSACFLLPKTYVNDDITMDDGKHKPQKLTMKGFDFKNIRNVFTLEDFLDYLGGEIGNISVVEKPKFATFKTALRMGAFVTMKNEPTIKRQVDEKREADYFAKTGKRKKIVKEEYKLSQKTLQGHYNKRKITKDGFDSEPLLIRE